MTHGRLDELLVCVFQGAKMYERKPGLSDYFSSPVTRVSGIKSLTLL